MTKQFHKITTGYVVQNFITLGGKHICTSQEFVAGDEVEYQNDLGDFVDINEIDEQYCPMEMKEPQSISKESLTFTCPECGSHRLECWSKGDYSREVLSVPENGAIDFGATVGFGNCKCFSCVDCNYELTQTTDDLDRIIVTEHQDVVKWIKDYCEQG